MTAAAAARTVESSVRDSVVMHSTVRHLASADVLLQLLQPVMLVMLGC